MSKIQLRGNKVGVQKLKKPTKSTGVSTFIVIPESDEYLGVIKYLGPDAPVDLKVDQYVYFGTNFQQVKINGADICIMEPDQVFATTEA